MKLHKKYEKQRNLHNNKFEKEFEDRLMLPNPKPQEKILLNWEKEADRADKIRQKHIEEIKNRAKVCA